MTKKITLPDFASTTSLVINNKTTDHLIVESSTRTYSIGEGINLIAAPNSVAAYTSISIHSGAQFNLTLDENNELTVICSRCGMSVVPKQHLECPKCDSKIAKELYD